MSNGSNTSENYNTKSILPPSIDFETSSPASYNLIPTLESEFPSPFSNISSGTPTENSKPSRFNQPPLQVKSHTPRGNEIKIVNDASTRKRRNSDPSSPAGKSTSREEPFSLSSFFTNSLTRASAFGNSSAALSTPSRTSLSLVDVESHDPPNSHTQQNLSNTIGTLGKMTSSLFISASKGINSITSKGSKGSKKSYSKKKKNTQAETTNSETNFIYTREFPSFFEGPVFIPHYSLIFERVDNELAQNYEYLKAAKIGNPLPQLPQIMSQLDFYGDQVSTQWGAPKTFIELYNTSYINSSEFIQVNQSLIRFHPLSPAGFHQNENYTLVPDARYLQYPEIPRQISIDQLICTFFNKRPIAPTSSCISLTPPRDFPYKAESVDSLSPEEEDFLKMTRSGPKRSKSPSFASAPTPGPKFNEFCDFDNPDHIRMPSHVLPLPIDPQLVIFNYLVEHERFALVSNEYSCLVDDLDTRSIPSTFQPDIVITIQSMDSQNISSDETKSMTKGANSHRQETPNYTHTIDVQLTEFHPYSQRTFEEWDLLVEKEILPYKIAKPKEFTSKELARIKTLFSNTPQISTPNFYTINSPSVVETPRGKRRTPMGVYSAISIPNQSHVDQTDHNTKEIQDNVDSITSDPLSLDSINQLLIKYPNVNVFPQPLQEPTIGTPLPILKEIPSINPKLVQSCFDAVEKLKKDLELKKKHKNSSFCNDTKPNALPNIQAVSNSCDYSSTVNEHMINTNDTSSPYIFMNKGEESSFTNYTIPDRSPISNSSISSKTQSESKPPPLPPRQFTVSMSSNKSHVIFLDNQQTNSPTKPTTHSALEDLFLPSTIGSTGINVQSTPTLPSSVDFDNLKTEVDYSQSVSSFAWDHLFTAKTPPPMNNNKSPDE